MNSVDAGSLSSLIAEGEQLTEFLDASEEELPDLRSQVCESWLHHGIPEAPLSIKSLEFILGAFSNPFVALSLSHSLSLSFPPSLSPFLSVCIYICVGGVLFEEWWG